MPAGSRSGCALRLFRGIGRPSRFLAPLADRRCFVRFKRRGIDLREGILDQRVGRLFANHINRREDEVAGDFWEN